MPGLPESTKASAAAPNEEVGVAEMEAFSPATMTRGTATMAVARTATILADSRRDSAPWARRNFGTALASFRSMSSPDLVRSVAGPRRSKFRLVGSAVRSTAQSPGLRRE